MTLIDRAALRAEVLASDDQFVCTADGWAAPDPERWPDEETDLSVEAVLALIDAQPAAAPSPALTRETLAAALATVHSDGPLSKWTPPISYAEYADAILAALEEERQ